MRVIRPSTTCPAWRILAWSMPIGLGEIVLTWIAARIAGYAAVGLPILLHVALYWRFRATLQPWTRALLASTGCAAGASIPVFYLFGRSLILDATIEACVLTLEFGLLSLACIGVARLIDGPTCIQDGTLCPHCGYSLIGNESERCPECGDAYSPADLSTD